MWMLKLATQVPFTIQIQGINIGSCLFPTIYPTNLHFSINSITSLPDCWTSSFAFIHQRLLLGALTADMWKAKIAEIYCVLIPGGWAEFLEVKIGLCFLWTCGRIKTRSSIAGEWVQGTSSGEPGGETSV